MLRPRIIPCLLVHKGGLVKTVRFADPKYVGDPINAVRIFNEKEVDEIIVADIDATVQNRLPDYVLISKLAAECRMPICYAGGVKTVDQLETIISLGVEKVGISSAAIADPDLIAQASRRVGSQSVVVVLDVFASTSAGHYVVMTHNGKRSTNIDPINFARLAADAGAGEILINAIDRDGTNTGYDLPLMQRIRDVVSIPITALGGAGTMKDLEQLFNQVDLVGGAAGSLFVFKGKFRAVLIQYPTRTEKEQLIQRSSH